MDSCLICNRGPVRLVELNRTIRADGREIVVGGNEGYQCDACGESFFDGIQIEAMERRLAAARRDALGLLPPAEILAIRQSVALSQAQLETALGVGPKTIVRWENGTAVQSKAADDVLRLIALDRDNLRFLAKIRDVDFTERVEQKKYSACFAEEPDLFDGVRAALAEAGDVREARLDEVAASVVRAIGAVKEARLQRMLAKEKAR